MNYIKPDKVCSPKDCVSNVNVLLDNGEDSFSLAKINWDGKDCLAIRWNVAMREWDDEKKINGKKECVGMPTSRGYPVWFLLPEEFIKSLDKNSNLYKKINNSLI